MTLLSICQGAADEVGITRPSSVAGSAQTEAQKLFRYANKAGNRLMKVYAWQDLRKEQTFTALGQETQTGILPADFDRFIPETFWDRTNKVLVTGPITAVEWQTRKAQGYTGVFRKFIYRGSSILANPVFDGGESLAFEYVSSKWCESAASVAQTAFAADTDVPLIDEELFVDAVVFEFQTGEGLPITRSFDYANLAIDNDQPSSQILVAADIFGGGRHFSGIPGAGGSEFIP